MSPPSGSTKVARSSIDGSRPPPLRSLHALNGSILSASSGATIPSKSSRTSTFTTSQSLKSDVKSNGMPFTRSSSTKLLDDTVSEGRPPRPNKRKRDSEPHSGSSTQLREAQEKVEQKRAKIAARVPSGMAPGNTGPPLKQLTSLVDLYARLRRDSGTSGQEDASNVPLTPKADPGNRQIVNHPPQRSSPGRSTASSPDPIALKEEDQEVILVKHIRPSPRQAHARPKPMSRLIDLANLSLSLKHKSGASTPLSNGATPNGVGKSPDKPQRSISDFAVVVSPPSRHATQKSKEPDTSRSHDDALPVSAPDAMPMEASRKNVNSKVPETIILDTPSLTPPPRTRAPKAVADSAPEQGLRRSRRVIGYLNGSSLTSEDIDDLLDATPVPFNLTPSHIHLPAGDGSGDNGSVSEDKSLWWQHPTFQARVKADVQRTLRLLLPADPAEDPPPPIGVGAGRWRGEVRPRQPRTRMWAERLEDAFGPGPLDRGLGRKPRRVARPTGAARQKSNEDWLSKRVAEAAAFRPPTMVLPNPLPNGYVHPTLEPPSQRRSPSLNDTNDPNVVPDDTTTNADVNEGEAAAWTAALLPLVKGKTTMDEAGMARTNDTLAKVEHASDQGLLTLGMLEDSALAETVRRLSELEDVPLGDAYGLRDRARTLAERWRETFGGGLLS